MSPLTPTEQIRRRRIESLLTIAAPALDALLAAGDRLSRILGSDDDYLPIRAQGEAFELSTRLPERSSD